jgi:hypothetical protein
MEARRTGRLALRAAILVIAVAVVGAVTPVASGHRSLNFERAERAAREAVVAHRSYRQITSTQSGLVTRACWRVPAAGVRCSLYVVAPSPCALESDPAGICVQALWERRWLVEARRGRHGVTAHILKISSGPSVAPGR